jgi:hypothetical protein
MTPYRLFASPAEIRVESPRLQVSGRWEANAAPYRHTVYECADGTVEWNCQQPRSLVELNLGGRELIGLGYAECLTVTLPPWRLPLRHLRWGRFVSEEDSLAWVDWQGPFATSFAIHNGAPCQPLSVSDGEVVLADATLRMGESLPLRAGRLGTTVLPGAPALAKLLPGSLFNIEEHKWRSRGILNTPERVSRGWAIHEVVHWKP